MERQGKVLTWYKLYGPMGVVVHDSGNVFGGRCTLYELDTDCIVCVRVCTMYSGKLVYASCENFYIRAREAF